MKKFYLLGVILAALITSIYFVSCTEDHDGSSSKNPLVGTWVTTTGDSYSGFEEDYLMFCKNGVAYSFYECDEHVMHASKVNYEYDEEKSQIIISNKYFSRPEVIRVVKLTSKELIIDDGDGDYYQFKKTSTKFSQSKLEKYAEEDDSWS